MVTSSEVYYLPDGTRSPIDELDQQQTGYGPLCRLYETKDGWLCAVAPKDEQFRALCAALGAPGLATDRRFATQQARDQNADALAGEFERRFKTRTAQEWFAALDAAGVPCEVSINNGASRLFDDPANLASGLVAQYEHPVYGRMKEIGLTIRLSETPGHVWGPPPLIGQHTRDILGEIGYDATAQQDLRTRKVVTWPEPAKA
jgi:crotonobetainyl-CoA:carnitine CoA-transferase CaiB-like acyl-CoA transferase